MTKTDRRVERTRALMQKALIDLIRVHSYDTITIQEIVDRANVGRATFYVHYRSKDDLFMSCHEAILHDFQSGLLYSHPLSREELLSPEAPPGLADAYRHLEAARTQLSPIFQGRDGALILRRICKVNAQEIEVNLRSVFADTESIVPLDLLATYLAGAQIALVQWWLEKRQPQSSEKLAQIFHHLQSAAIRDAFGLGIEQAE